MFQTLLLACLPGLTLHACPACSYERFDLFPYNNGVMLWNMPFMRKTNDEFVDWILNQHNGLHYGSEHGVVTAAGWPATCSVGGAGAASLAGWSTARSLPS